VDVSPHRKRRAAGGDARRCGYSCESTPDRDEPDGASSELTGIDRGHSSPALLGRVRTTPQPATNIEKFDDAVRKHIRDVLEEARDQPRGVSTESS
jgi:hypothetical protein